jgi:6-phosphogluconolactonase
LIAGAASLVIEALEGSGSYPRLVLAGGSTPVRLHESLGGHRTNPVWKHLRVTFSDERAVPPDHEDSNYGMAERTLIRPLGIPAKSVLRFRGEDGARRAARKAHLELVSWAQRVPLFDVVLMGLGEDGHVASLFPGEVEPDFGSRLAAGTRHPGGDDRISLTPQALRSTRRTFFLVSGEGKAEAVARALTAVEPSWEIPARVVVGKNGATWLMDEAAASRLPEGIREPDHAGEGH